MTQPKCTRVFYILSMGGWKMHTSKLYFYKHAISLHAACRHWQTFPTLTFPRFSVILFKVLKLSGWGTQFRALLFSNINFSMMYASRWKYNPFYVHVYIYIYIYIPMKNRCARVAKTYNWIKKSNHYGNFYHHLEVINWFLSIKYYIIVRFKLMLYSMKIVQ